jgi:enolase
MKIKKISSIQILDSRGIPTIRCQIELYNGKIASAIVPSGMSTGTYEALELRDGGKAYMGKSVQKAVFNVNNIISKKITGKGFGSQKEIDDLLIVLDGTKNKSKLGANAILAVSLAAARAAASNNELELFEYLGRMDGRTANKMPVPFCNIINGGVHAGTDLKIQEFMIAPIGAKSFSEGVRMVVETYQTLKAELKKKYGNSSVNVGDEGGFAPPLKNAEDALEFIQVAVEKAGYAGKVRIALDAAASEFYKDGKYELDGKKFGQGELIDHYSGLIGKYGIISIEDPFQEDQFDGFFEFTKKMGGKVQVVADDLTVTNMERLEMAIEKKCANCLLLKVNQIGSLSESIKAANYSFKNGWGVMVSHRSGETEDAFISDLAVGIGSRQIKLGAPARGERTAKYNRLLLIESMLGAKAKYGWIR